MTDAPPWVKWRFDKWRGDEGLRMCGLAARGLWVEMLAIMHGGQPYGHLAINGRPPSSRQIASLVGMATEKEVTALLRELEEAGVFSRSEAGLIYSRRMVRDNAARETGRQFGLDGGNPVLTGRPPKRVNGDEQHRVNGSLNLTLNPPPKPRDRGREREEDSQSGLGTKAAHAGIATAVPDPLKTGMADMVTVDGHPTINGFHVDIVFESCCRDARVSLPSTLTAWQPVCDWLRAGYTSGEILWLIRRIAARPDYKPPRTLAFFNRPIREDCRTGDPPNGKSSWHE